MTETELIIREGDIYRSPHDVLYMVRDIRDQRVYTTDYACTHPEYHHTLTKSLADGRLIDGYKQLEARLGDEYEWIGKEHINFKCGDLVKVVDVGKSRLQMFNQRTGLTVRSAYLVLHYVDAPNKVALNIWKKVLDRKDVPAYKPIKTTCVRCGLRCETVLCLDARPRCPVCAEKVNKEIAAQTYAQEMRKRDVHIARLTKLRSSPLPKQVAHEPWPEPRYSFAYGTWQIK